MANTLTDAALSLPHTVVNALIAAKQLPSDYTGDEDLLSHLMLVQIERYTEYNPALGASYATFMSNVLRHEAIRYAESERMQGMTGTPGTDEARAISFVPIPEDRDIIDEDSGEIEDTPTAAAIADLAIPSDVEGQQEVIAMALSGLDPHNATLLRLHYGLDGHRAHTLRELAVRFGWGYPEAARRKIEHALQRVRDNIGGHIS